MSWCSLAVCLPACFPEYWPGGMPALSFSRDIVLQLSFAGHFSCRIFSPIGQI